MERRDGDLPNPRGGVIPDKMNYPTDSEVKVGIDRSGCRELHLRFGI